MNFDWNSSYFFKLADWIKNSEPGVFEIKDFTKEPDKFKKHIEWYNMCKPDGFNSVKFISDTQFKIVKA